MCRLDGDVDRRGNRVQRDRGPEVREPPVDPVVDRIRVELELRGPPAKADTDALHPCLERLFVDVVERDFVARFERNLGDPRAHRPGADDADHGAGEVVRPVGLVHGLTVRQRPGQVGPSVDHIDSFRGHGSGSVKFGRCDRRDRSGIRGQR